MKRLLSLLLAFLCLLGLCACGGESVKVEYDEASLYPGEDITLRLLAVHPTESTVEFEIKNGSEHELIYGQPFLSFARKTPGGWKRLPFDTNASWTMEAYSIPPGESVELEMSTERYLDGLRFEKEYRACFEFFYYTENPEDDGSGNFQRIKHDAYLLRDFVVEREVA